MEQEVSTVDILSSLLTKEELEDVLNKVILDISTNLRHPVLACRDIRQNKNCADCNWGEKMIKHSQTVCKSRLANVLMLMLR